MTMMMLMTTMACVRHSAGPPGGSTRLVLASPVYTQRNCKPEKVSYLLKVTGLGAAAPPLDLDDSDGDPSMSPRCWTRVACDTAPATAAMPSGMESCSGGFNRRMISQGAVFIFQKSRWLLGGDGPWPSRAGLKAEGQGFNRPLFGAIQRWQHPGVLMGSVLSSDQEPSHGTTSHPKGALSPWQKACPRTSSQRTSESELMCPQEK